MSAIQSLANKVTDARTLHKALHADLLSGDWSVQEFGAMSSVFLSTLSNRERWFYTNSEALELETWKDFQAFLVPEVRADFEIDGLGISLWSFRSAPTPLFRVAGFEDGECLVVSFHNGPPLGNKCSMTFWEIFIPQ